jgi:small subunit ribosomal protein S24e
MDIEIVEKKNNPLLQRTEVRFMLHHTNAQTPSRDQVREKLAAQVGSKKSLVVVESMNSLFGRSQTRGYARVYETPEAIGKNEPTYLLKRNKLEDLKPKKKEREAPPAKAKAKGKR